MKQSPGRRAFLPSTLLMCLLLAAVLYAGLRFGAAPLTHEQIMGALKNLPDHQSSRIILLFLRLPRVLAGLLAGGALAAAGLLLQTVTANPLCAPNIIGVNAGAGFGMMLVMCLFPALHTLQPLAAFLGAFGASMLVIFLASAAGGRRSMSRSTLVLAGVALSSVLSAGISALSLTYPDLLASYAAFSVGGLTGVTAEQLYLPAAVILPALLCAYLLIPRLSLLCLGDSMAQSLGVRVRRLRVLSTALASLLCAAVVSYAGLLGFVGLMVPHAARKIAGTSLYRQMSASLLLGGILVVGADLLGRVLFAPSELPVGILMAVLGAPFFLFLLLRRRGGEAL